MSRGPYSSAFERWFDAVETSHIERNADSWMMRHFPAQAGQHDAGPQIWLMLGCMIASFGGALIIVNPLAAGLSLSQGAYTAILMSLWLTLGMVMATGFYWRRAMRIAWRIERARATGRETP